MIETGHINGTFVIGIGHKALQGKDTAALAIAALLPAGFVARFAFADQLKRYCHEHHGMVQKDSSLLQRIGLEMRRADPGRWIRFVHAAIARDRPAVAVITDVRFANEFAFVRRLGGITVRVRRWQRGGRRFIASDRAPDHVSERELEGAPWDYTIDNYDGEIDDYMRRVRSLCAEIATAQGLPWSSLMR